MTIRTPARPRVQRKPVDRHLLAWRNTVFGIFGMSGFVLASWLSRVPNVRDLLHASTAEMGLLIVGLAAGSVLGLLLASHVIARFGANATIRWAYTLSASGVVLAGILTLVAPSLIGIFFGLAVLGFGGSVVDVAVNLSGATNERAIGRTLMPLFHAGFSLGTVLGAGFGALMVALAVPISLHVCAVALLAIIANQLVVRFLGDAEPPLATGAIAVHATWRSRLEVWADRRVIAIGVVVLGMAFVEGSANDWLSLAMIDGHGVSNATGATIYGVFVAAMTIGRLIGGPVLNRLGRVATIRLSAGFAIVGLLLVILIPSVAVSVVGVVLWGLGAALGFPVGISAAADDPRYAAARVSAVATIGYTAFLVGPPLIGGLGQAVGLLPALLVAAALTLVAGGFAGSLQEPDRGVRSAAAR